MRVKRNGYRCFKVLIPKKHSDVLAWCVRTYGPSGKHRPQHRWDVSWAQFASCGDTDIFIYEKKDYSLLLLTWPELLQSVVK